MGFVRRTVNWLALGLLVILCVSTPYLVRPPIGAASQQVFSSYDAVVPGYPLALVSGSDVPGTIYTMTNGQRLWPTYSNQTTVGGYNVHPVAGVQLTYGDVPSEVFALYNSNAQTYVNVDWMNQFKTSSDFRIVKMDVQADSRTFIVIGKAYEFLSYYIGAAYTVVYDPAHPNFTFYIHVGGDFLSEGDLVNDLNMLSAHFAAVVAAKEQHPWFNATFADGTTSGPLNAAVKLSGGNWTPNTAVNIISACTTPWNVTIPASQVDSSGRWSTTTTTVAQLDPGTYTITATQGALQVIVHLTIVASSGTTTTTTTAKPDGYWVVTRTQGNVLVQRGGNPPWIPVTEATQLNEGDVIKAEGPGGVSSHSIAVAYVSYQTWEDYKKNPIGIWGLNRQGLVGMVVADGEVILMGTNKAGNLGLKVGMDSTTGGCLFYFSSGSLSIDADNVLLESARILDKGTEYEVVGDVNGTTVYTLNGTVLLSDLNGTQAVTIGANQKATVSASGSITGASSFNPSSVDRWWEDALPQQPSTTTTTTTSASATTSTMTTTSASTSASNGATNGSGLGTLAQVMGDLPTIIAVVVAVILAVTALSYMRKRGRGQPRQ